MIRNYIYFFVIVAVMSIHSYGQKVTGCYSDLREISEGIVGSGVIKIWVSDHKYVGTFAELSNELGLTYDETPLKNLSYNKRTRKIKFYLTFHSAGSLLPIKYMTGNVSRLGIKMNWYGRTAMYGSADPFMKRKNRECW